MHAPVSVVIPCYRCAETIERAVASVALQSLMPAEIILIDDFSNDHGMTLAALNRVRQKFGDAFPILLIQLQANGGPGTARNAGWDAASGEYVAFLDADDSWHPEKVEIQYKWMVCHPEVTLTGHSSRQIKLGKDFPALPGKWQASRITPRSLLISNRFPTRSVMLKRELPYRFVPGKRFAEDYLLWLTVVLKGHTATLLELPLAYSYKSNFGEGGLTRALWKMEKGELDTYTRIYRDELISLPTYLASLVHSFAKYLRRLALCLVTGRT